MRKISADEIEKITKRAFAQAAERDREERRQAAEQLQQDSALARARDAVRRDLLANPDVDQARNRLSQHQPATAGGVELTTAAADRAALEVVAGALPPRPLDLGTMGMSADERVRARKLEPVEAAEAAQLREQMLHASTPELRERARVALNKLGHRQLQRRLAGLEPR